jgi:hypothetical protein
MDTLTLPSIGECRFNARECRRWAEASANEQSRKALLEVAEIWAARARNEQATIRLRESEVKARLSIGFRSSNRPLQMRQERPDWARLPGSLELVKFARHGRNCARDRTRVKAPLLEEASPHSCERAIAWGLAVSVIVLTVAMIWRG